MVNQLQQALCFGLLAAVNDLVHSFGLKRIVQSLYNEKKILAKGKFMGQLFITKMSIKSDERFFNSPELAL